MAAIKPLAIGILLMIVPYSATKSQQMNVMLHPPSWWKNFMQMKPPTIFLFACMILCWISVPSQAAEISCAPRSTMPMGVCITGLLSGRLSKGDYEKVVTFLGTRTILGANYLNLSEFHLVSPEGDVNEALKIGRLFRQYFISTTAPLQLPDGNTHLPWCDRNCGVCASACALIWFGGVDRSGTVGLHRPQINDPMFRGLSPADASTAYRRVLGRITTYLDEMEVPKSIIESMVATGSGDIRWVDYLDDRLDRPPSIAEWVDASCGSRDPYQNAIRQNAQPSDALTRRYTEHLKCQTVLFDGHRDRLAPPLPDDLNDWVPVPPPGFVLERP